MFPKERILLPIIWMVSTQRWHKKDAEKDLQNSYIPLHFFKKVALACKAKACQPSEGVEVSNASRKIHFQEQVTPFL